MDPITMLLSGQGLKVILAILAVLGVAGAAWKVKGWKDDKQVSRAEAKVAKVEAENKLATERARADHLKSKVQAQEKTAQAQAQAIRKEEKIRHETNHDDVMPGLDSMFDGFRVPDDSDDSQ